jgi:hypothetical protein
MQISSSELIVPLFLLRSKRFYALCAFMLVLILTYSRCMFLMWALGRFQKIHDVHSKKEVEHEKRIESIRQTLAQLGQTHNWVERTTGSSPPAIAKQLNSLEQQVQLESKQLLQTRMKREQAASQVATNKAEGSCFWLSGEAWYAQQAFRALNQALGRCIRHRHDYGTLLLVDSRFTDDQKLSKLPQWLRGRVSVGLAGGLGYKNSFRDVQQRLLHFFEKAPAAVAAMKQKDEQAWQEAEVRRQKAFVLAQAKEESEGQGEVEQATKKEQGEAEQATKKEQGTPKHTPKAEAEASVQRQIAAYTEAVKLAAAYNEAVKQGHDPAASKVVASNVLNEDFPGVDDRRVKPKVGRSPYDDKRKATLAVEGGAEQATKKEQGEEGQATKTEQGKEGQAKEGIAEDVAMGGGSNCANTEDDTVDVEMAPGPATTLGLCQADSAKRKLAECAWSQEV